MPEPDGIETLGLIRQDSEGKNLDTDVIVLTANAIKGAAEQYAKAGFADYITKPVEFSTLEKTLAKYIEKRDGMSLFVINKDTGISHCGGLEDLYDEILGDYIDKTKEYREEIKSYYAEENWKEYARISHTLKSTSLTIGLEEFPDIAKEHEFAGKAEDAELIKNKFEAFIDAIDKAISTVESAR